MEKLNGSEKQIVWAKQIREIILNGDKFGANQGIKQEIERLGNCLENDIEDLADVGTPADEIEDIKNDIVSGKRKIELFNELKNRVENETESEWFIDNRNNGSLFTKHVHDVAYNERESK